MRTDSEIRSNFYCDWVEVSRWHSSQTPIVIVGTRWRPEPGNQWGACVAHLPRNRPDLRIVAYIQKPSLGYKWANRPIYFKNFRETPCAEPNAGYCGGWGLETSVYSIIFHYHGTPFKSAQIIKAGITINGSDACPTILALSSVHLKQTRSKYGA